MLFWNLVVEPLFFAFVSGPFAILCFLLGLILLSEHHGKTI